MIQEVYQLIENFSKLHAVPLFTWNESSKKILDEILSGLPYFITPQGNVFIGSTTPDNIQANRVCLQAHLDHPGGYLQYDHEGKYFYANIFGYGHSSFTGQSMGIFTAGTLFPLAEMEVEHTCRDDYGGISIFFKDENSALVEHLKKQNFIVHMNTVPQINDDKLSNWSLDNMIHMALVVYLLKNYHLSPKFYGLLTVNEEMGQAGIREFSRYLREKNLFLVNLDVTGDHNQGIPGFGVRKKQKGQSLDQYLPPALTSWLIEQNRLVELAKGGTETDFLISQELPALSIYLMIENIHNNIAQKRCIPEMVNLTLLEEYFLFLKEFLGQPEIETLPISSSTVEAAATTASPAKPMSRQAFRVNLKDYTEDIKKIFQPLNSFQDYLHTGLPELRAIYQKYQLVFPNINRYNFDKLRQQVLALISLPFQDELVLDLAEALATELELAFEAPRGFIKQQVPEIKILVVALASFNACNHNYPERLIAYSADKLSAPDLPRVIIHELTHYFTWVFWPEMNLNPRLRQYYDEGLAVYLVAKILKVPLAKALNMTPEQIDAFYDNEAILRKQFSDFSKGNLCQIFRGKYHTYFKSKEIKDPFKIKAEPFDRYGYFLAAQELERTYGKGVVNAKTFCQ